MRKALAFVSILVSLLSVGTVASAAGLSNSYKAVYCYPTGSYWQSQIAAYPDYYAANDAYYRANYGPGTVYCN